MPPSARAPVTAKMPAIPTCAASTGAGTSDSANIRPMLAPTSAIALVRTSSRVRSASIAVTAADTAPAPCSARPMTSSASAAGRRQQAAGGEHQQPEHDDRLAAHRSEAMPKGNCSMRPASARRCPSPGRSGPGCRRPGSAAPPAQTPAAPGTAPACAARRWTPASRWRGARARSCWWNRGPARCGWQRRRRWRTRGRLVYWGMGSRGSIVGNNPASISGE
jgi:hypothetical protein